MDAIRLDPFSLLPKFVSLHVLSYLHPVELAQCCQVNKKWKALATHDLLWKPLLDVYRSNNIDTKGLRVWSLIIPSSDALYRKTINLCENIQLNQDVTFTCFALNNDTPLMKLNLSCTHHTCFFPKRININCILFESKPIYSKYSKQYLSWEKTVRYFNWSRVVSSPIEYPHEKSPHRLKNWAWELLHKKSVFFHEELQFGNHNLCGDFQYYITKAIEERLKEIYLELKKKDRRHFCIIN